MRDTLTGFVWAFVASLNPLFHCISNYGNLSGVFTMSRQTRVQIEKQQFYSLVFEIDKPLAS